MSNEWKRFLLQWILPVGIFLILMISLFAGFSSNIKQETSEDYESTLTRATNEYAISLSDAIKKTESLGLVAADAISSVGKDINDPEVVTILNSVVSRSNAYLALISDEKGNTMTNSGSSLNYMEYSYFDEIYNDEIKNYHYVNNDEVRGFPALIITVPIKIGEDQNRKLFIYYPFDEYEFRKIVTVDKDYDTQANSIVVDNEGVIISSISADQAFAANNNVWDVFEDDATAIKRYRSKVQARGTGKFETVSGGVEYVVCYAPIEGTTESLLVTYTKTAMEKAESLISNTSLSILNWFLIVVVLFIVVMSILNIVQIYVSTRASDDLKDKADSDQLTGLRNKVATEREIKSYIENHPDDMAMMFLVDIDNFKKINDTMGHAFGDEVLRELGRNIGINFRVSDIIGRIGGDEFMIFLKNLKEDQNTIREAQKLTYFFKHFQVGDYVKYSVTASIGAAVYPAHGADFDALYKAADQAVYKSKKRGKNQLSFYDDRDKTPEEVAYADAHLIDIERKEKSTPIEN